MGNTESPSDWQSDYQQLYQLSPNEKMLKRMSNNELYLLLTLPIAGPTSPLTDRIKNRVAPDKPQHLTPLVSWQRKDDPSLCSTKESLQLIFANTGPTLQQHLQQRRAFKRGFNQNEILYIVKQIAKALRELQNIKQEHGKVSLDTICISTDVLLLDCLILEGRQKQKVTKDHYVIEGFPSPQKLRTYYDTIANFEQLRGDLFSLGMVALQLYHYQENVQSVYSNLDPRYSNYKIDLNALAAFLERVREQPVRDIVHTLLCLQSKLRLNVYQLMKDIKLDLQKVYILKEKIEDKLNVGETKREPDNVSPNITQANQPNPEYKDIATSHVRKLQTVTVNPNRYFPPEEAFMTSGYFIPEKRSQITSMQQTSRPASSNARSSTHYGPSVHTNNGPQVSFKSANQTQIHPINLNMQQTPPTSSNLQHTQPGQLRINNPYQSNPIATIPKSNLVSAPYQPNTITHTPPTLEPITHTSLQSFTLPTTKPTSIQYKPSPPTNITSLTSSTKSESGPLNFRDFLPKNNTEKKPIERLQKYQTTSPIYSLQQEQRILDYKGHKINFYNVTTALNFSEPVVTSSQKPLNFTLLTSDPSKPAESISKPAQSISKPAESISKPAESIYHDEPRPVMKLPLPGSNQPTKEIKVAENMEGATSTVSRMVQQNPPQVNSKQDNNQNKQVKFPSNSPGSTVMVIQNLQINTPNDAQSHKQYGAGTRYEGSKLNGLRHGKGKFFYKQGSYFDGEWCNNQMHGFGTLYYPNGTIAYEGEWKYDEFDGKGTVYNDQQVKLQGTFDFTDFNKIDEEWVRYEGDLKNDAKDGFGRLFLTNGEIYAGEFSQDMVHGVGVFTSGKSQKRGVWEYGKLKKLI